MGVSRDTFYRYQAAREAGGIEALFDVSRRKPNLKNRVDEVTEEAVVRFATDYPAYGQIRASNELRKGGIVVFPLWSSLGGGTGWKRSSGDWPC